MRLAANSVTDLRYIVQATTTGTMLAYVKRRPLVRHRLEGDTGRGGYPSDILASCFDNRNKTLHLYTRLRRTVGYNIIMPIFRGR